MLYQLKVEGLKWVSVCLVVEKTGGESPTNRATPSKFTRLGEAGAVLYVVGCMSLSY